MDLKRRLIVLSLCPEIVDTPVSKVVTELQLVLGNKCTIRKIGHEWHASGEDLRCVFSEEPTREYLRRVMNQPHDLRRHFAAVNNLVKTVVEVSRNCNPNRQVALTRREVKCKYCGGTEWKETPEHFVCANGHCATVRTKYEQGLDYRNIKERSQAQGDSNSSNYHTIDPLMSDAANRQTVVSVAPGVAAGAKPGDGPISVRNLNSWNKRMHKKDIPEIDRQKVRAKVVIEDLCDDLALHPLVKRKAFDMFCKFVHANASLPRENDIIAACLFYALPPKPKIYPKKKKRALTPYNDTRKKRLKFMTFPRSGRANSI